MKEQTITKSEELAMAQRREVLTEVLRGTLQPVPMAHHILIPTLEYGNEEMFGVQRVLAAGRPDNAVVRAPKAQEVLIRGPRSPGLRSFLKVPSRETQLSAGESFPCSSSDNTAPAELAIVMLSPVS
jgi:hypothetical protein